MIVHNTKEGEYSENTEILERILFSDKIVDLYKRYLERMKYCTEDYKGWNYLKSKLLEDYDILYKEQLKTTVCSIGFNPKSYESWYHRYFINKNSIIKESINEESIKGESINEESINEEIIKGESINEESIKGESINEESIKGESINENSINENSINKNSINEEIIKKKILNEEKDLLLILLKADKRNLHCWNYINKLYTDFSFIPRDVSNYSYLHYAKGFDSISCVFTDFYDQGMWFYYFTCKEKELLQREFYIRVYKEEIAIVFEDIFQGTININNNITFVNIPVKYINIPIKYINKLLLNGKEYIMEKYNSTIKYYTSIYDLDYKCYYNNIFNYDVEWKSKIYEQDMWKEYFRNVENDKYEIFIIK